MVRVEEDDSRRDKRQEGRPTPPVLITPQNDKSTENLRLQRALLPGPRLHRRLWNIFRPSGRIEGGCAPLVRRCGLSLDLRLR